MKRMIMLLVFLLSAGHIQAETKINKEANEIPSEMFSTCGNYATTIATYSELRYGANYWTVWYNAYGECLDKYY